MEEVEQIKRRALELDEIGVPRTKIAQELGVHRVTIMRWFGKKERPRVRQHGEASNDPLIGDIGESRSAASVSETEPGSGDAVGVGNGYNG